MSRTFKRATLSVCCVASSPGPFLRNSLAPLREVADEILVVAEGVVSDYDLQCYGDIADRLFSAGAVPMEEHLAWLYAQCRADWILRINGDEFPSEEMVSEISSILECPDPEICSVTFARRTILPMVYRYITQSPWCPDFQARMMRNNRPLTFADSCSQQETKSVARTGTMRRQLTSLYYLPFIATHFEEQFVRAERYKLLTDGLDGPPTIPAYGIPAYGDILAHEPAELKSTLMPSEDRARVEMALSASGSAQRDRVAASVAPRKVTPLRTASFLPEPTFSANIMLIGIHSELTAGESRAIYLRIFNRGNQEWSWRLGREPYAYVVHRLIHENGEPVDSWRPAYFTEQVKSGAATVVLSHINAPLGPGIYTLEAKICRGPNILFGDLQAAWFYVVPKRVSDGAESHARLSRKYGDIRPYHA